MARIAGVPPARAGLLVRFAYRFAQRIASGDHTIFTGAARP